MKSFRRWAMAAAVVLAGCGDGGIQSPDFTPVTTVEQVVIDPGTPQQLPAGTTLSLSAVATITQTVPPGTRDGNGNPITEQTKTETVTQTATWTSTHPAVATVNRGVVTAVAPGSTTIKATFEGVEDSVAVTVTGAALASVEYVKPEGVARTVNDTYTVLGGASVPFEIYGRFTDGSVRRLVEGTDPNQFQVAWTTDNALVAGNPGDDRNFQTAAVGTAHITGRVTNVQGINPDSATATLNVQEANEFCASQFTAPAAKAVGAVSQACLGCSVEQPGLVIDGDLDTYATMSIGAGLLFQSNTSVTVYDTTAQRIVIGSPTGFVVSRSVADSMSSELLSTLTIDTLSCNAQGECSVVETFNVEDNSLTASLLGRSVSGGDDALVLAATDPVTQNANGLRLTFDGGLLTLRAKLQVNTACGIATPSAN